MIETATSTALVPLAATPVSTTVEQESYERFRRYMRIDLAPTTARNYRSQWEAWEAHCAARGLTSMPANPLDVAQWLTDRVETGRAHATRAKLGRSGQTIGTLRAALAAIGAYHKAIAEQMRLAADELRRSTDPADVLKAVELGKRAEACTFDCAHPAIKRILGNIRRERPEAQRQARAMTGELLTAILGGMGDTLVDLRDAALLAVGYAAARRRSEIVGLDWSAHGDGDGWIAIDESSVVITLVRHKTAGSGDPLVVLIPRATNPGLTRALERWIAAAKIEPGMPLFFGLTKARTVLINRKTGQPERLNGQSVSGIIKRRVVKHLVAQGTDRERAEELAEAYSGHSLRSGFCTTAAEAGADPLAIATVSGHKSLAMVQRYTTQADKRRRSPHNLKGVGIGAGE